MKNVYALLLTLLGVICVVFNRFAVEEAYSLRMLFRWFRPPVVVARAVVVLSGVFFVVFGLLMVFGFLQ
jgi:hypothetical protein